MLLRRKRRSILSNVLLTRYSNMLPFVIIIIIMDYIMWKGTVQYELLLSD